MLGNFPDLDENVALALQAHISREHYRYAASAAGRKGMGPLGRAGGPGGRKKEKKRKKKKEKLCFTLLILNIKESCINVKQSIAKDS